MEVAEILQENDMRTIKKWCSFAVRKYELKTMHQNPMNTTSRIDEDVRHIDLIPTDYILSTGKP